MKNQAICPPEWLSKNAVYQINPRTFSKEGTLNAITKELPFLKELGFNIIYLCSICKADDSDDPTTFSPRQKASETGNPNNMYIINDYFDIDKEYGRMDDLKNLVNRAHELNMKVIFDLVYAHMAISAEIAKRYPDFVKQNLDGTPIISPWSSLTTDFKSEGLREYLYSNIIYYVSVVDIDGFRLDVGDLIPIDFWKTAREKMQSIKKDATFINEGHGYANTAIAFDACYCFPWHDVIRRIFCHEEPASDLRKTYENVLEKCPKGAKLLREVDNHDTVTDWKIRTETFAGHDGMEQIEVINYLIDGIPMVYSGNELACEADLNMFANRFYPGKYEVTDRNNKYSEVSLRRQNIMNTLNKMKAESDLLCYGETAWIDTSCPEKIVSFKRSLGDEEMIFIGNVKESEADIEIGDIIGDKKCILANGEHKTENGVLHLSAREYAVFA